MSIRKISLVVSDQLHHHHHSNRPHHHFNHHHHHFRRPGDEEEGHTISDDEKDPQHMDPHTSSRKEKDILTEPTLAAESQPASSSSSYTTLSDVPLSRATPHLQTDSRLMEHSHSNACANERLNRPSSQDSFQRYVKKLNSIDDADDTYLRANKDVSFTSLAQQHHPNVEQEELGQTAEKRGSIPMIGSLVYYKSKSDDALSSVYSSNPIDSSEANSKDSQLRNPIHYRHFSNPEVSPGAALSAAAAAATAKPRCWDDGEFSAINHRINMQMKTYAKQFQNRLNEERHRSHFCNAHFHIPGLDPEPSADLSPNQSVENVSARSRSQSSSSLSSKLQENVTEGMNSNSFPSPPTPTSPTNSRHRRRLTCAMIFTPPKVVEI